MDRNTESRENIAKDPSANLKEENAQICAFKRICTYTAWNLLGKRWTFLIITRLLKTSLSFQELFEHTRGISESVLAARLKELEREGVIQREVHKGRLI